MDELFEQMVIFEKSLREFNENIKTSMAVMKSNHALIDPVWNAKTDQLRRDYDKVWEPLKESMNYYLNKEGPNFVEYLNIKIYALGKYLGHRG